MTKFVKLCLRSSYQNRTPFNLTIFFGRSFFRSFFFLLVAHIFGHTHTDTFRVLTDKYHNPTGALLLAPSITPLVTHQYPKTVGTNPGIRQYLYRNNSKSLLDYQQYFVDLEKANLVEYIQWTLLYNFSQMYNVSDLTGSSLRKVLDTIKENPIVFDKAYQLNTLLHDNGPCDYYCSLNFVCAMGNTQEEDIDEEIEHQTEQETMITNAANDSSKVEGI